MFSVHSKHFKNNKGGTLLIVLVVMLVLFLLGFTLLDLSVGEARMATSQENHVKAHYVAKGGAEAVAESILAAQANNTINGHLTDLENNGADGSIGGHSFEVTIQLDHPGYDEVTITSVGTVTHGSLPNATDTVEIIMARGTSIFDYSLFGDEVLSGGPSANSTNIYGGDVGTNNDAIGNENRFIFYDNTDPSVANVISGKEGDKEAGITIPQINLSLFDGTNVINPSINHNGGGTRTLNIVDYSAKTVGDTTAVWAENPVFSLGGNYILDVVGPGEIFILVNSFSDGGNTMIMTSNGAVLHLYYNGTGTMTFNGHANFEGSIYAPNGTVEFNGGNAEITGAIIANRIEVNGGGTGVNVYFKTDLSSDTLLLPLDRYLYR